MLQKSLVAARFHVSQAATTARQTNINRFLNIAMSSHPAVPEVITAVDRVRVV
jgi:hypothetical protein